MNNSGIIALSGFTFQMKVFIEKLADIKENQIIGYEIGDDVSVSNLNDITEWNCTIKNENSLSLIQVKRTNVSKDIALKTLYNWLLAEDAKNYELIVAEGYTVEDSIITENNTIEIYNQLTNEKAETSLETRVFRKYKDNENYDEFEQKLTLIKTNYFLNSNYVVDENIYEKYKPILHNNNVEIYKKRLKKFIGQIVNAILIKADKREIFQIDYNQFMGMIDCVCMSISEDNYETDYDIFKQENNINITEEIKKKREYKQLVFCELSDNIIISRLVDELYYEDYKDHYLENGKKTHISNIESEAVANYEDSKTNEENDTPKKIYIDTLKRKIDKINKMHSNGTYISLTKESDKRISWKEE